MTDPQLESMTRGLTKIRIILPTPFRSGEQEVDPARIVERIEHIRAERAKIDEKFNLWSKHEEAIRGSRPRS